MLKSCHTYANIKPGQPVPLKQPQYNVKYLQRKKKTFQIVNYSTSKVKCTF